jgi:HK97 family phage major capsid protein
MSLFTQKELAKYSLTKALGEIANQSRPGIHGAATGLEREIHDVLSAQLKDLGQSQPTGFLIPLGALKSMNVTSAPTGGFTVGTDLAAIVPALRTKSVVLALGARVFDNLRGNLGLPTESTTYTAEWLSELEELEGSDAAYAQQRYHRGAALRWRHYLGNCFCRTVWALKILFVTLFCARSGAQSTEVP